ncbi:MAG: DUF1822 family protein [Richelia sp. RM2_1_2]|nr:DUF1822 family protein [Richelia sp. SM2_1_7]NJO64385.1 DUF1822 family protein [Richelia sp. RM2_1_2]
MNNNLNILRDLSIPFPITASFREQAKSYASQYFTQDAQKRIYFQTLALLAVDAYLRMLNFDTNLTKPERWNAAVRLWSEANEIELPRLGNLECCVITTGQQYVTLPPEQLGDSCGLRIGYLFVEIASSEKTATLIGFLAADGETIDTEVAITNLQSMDELIDYLSQQEASSPKRAGQINDLTQEFTEQKITYLRNWLNNIYEEDWEPSMRGLQTITCKKKFQLAGLIFEIQLCVSQQNDDLMLVRVIVQAESGALPMGMQVSVPDESDIYTETVNEMANLISIPLELAHGEEFWVELRIEESFIKEYFIA